MQYQNKKSNTGKSLVLHMTALGVLFGVTLGFMPKLAAAQNVVKICVEGAYPPFSTITPSGEVVGFDIDIANTLTKSMGKSAELVKVDWDGMIPALLAKKCDAIIASMSITPERKKKIDFTDKYYNTPARFAAKKNAKLTDTADGLKGKTVGVQRATVAEDYMKKKYPSVNLKSYASQEEVNSDLASGRLDAMFVDSVPLSDFLKSKQGRGFQAFGSDHFDPQILGEGVGIGLRKGDRALKSDFNQAIKSIRASGEYQKINKKYFDFDIYGK